MTSGALSQVEQETALRLGEEGRFADVLSYLGGWPAAAIEQSPRLSLLYGSAYARLGRPAEGLKWVELALSSARRDKDPAVERRALGARGAIALVAGRPDEGADFFTQGLLAASRDGDLATIGRCANNIGIVANIQGRHAEALSSYAMALAAFEQIGLHAGVAECHHNLGITYREQGALERALAEAIRASEAAEAAGDRSLVALALRGRAEIRLHRGELGRAGAEAREALEFHRGLGDSVRAAEDLRIVAGSLAGGERRDEAVSMLRDVIVQAAALERPLLAAEASRDLAALLLRAGRETEAREAARAAKAIFTKLGAEYELRRLAEYAWEEEFGAELRESLRPLHEAQRMADTGRYADLLVHLGQRAQEELERSPTLLLLMAVGHARLGQTDVARHWALAALTRARICGDRSVEIRALNVNGAIALERGGINEAMHFFARAQDEAVLDGDLATVGRAANNLGVIANMQGEYSRAVGAFTRAIAAYQRARSDRGMAESQHNLGIAYRQQGQLTEARHAADDAVHLATLAGDRSLRAQAIAGRAEISTACGDADLAIREAQIASDEHRALKDPVREAEDARILGNAMALSGRLDEATVVLRDVISRAETYARPLLVAITQRDLAQLELRQGNAQEARHLAQQARGTLKELGAIVEVEQLDRLLDTATG